MHRSGQVGLNNRELKNLRGGKWRDGEDGAIEKGGWSVAVGAWGVGLTQLLITQEMWRPGVGDITRGKGPLSSNSKAFKNFSFL